MPIARIALIAGGVVAGFFVVRSFSGDGVFWSQVRGFAAEREVELRDALGLNEEVA